ncbi:unnamed protein product [Lota lota]
MVHYLGRDEHENECTPPRSDDIWLSWSATDTMTSYWTRVTSQTGIRGLVHASAGTEEAGEELARAMAASLSQMYLEQNGKEGDNRWPKLLDNWGDLAPRYSRACRAEMSGHQVQFADLRRLIRIRNIVACCDLLRPRLAFPLRIKIDSEQETANPVPVPRQQGETERGVSMS